jgi:uncharacterized phage protein gp47/JayE
MAIEFSTISQIQERLANALILAVNAGQLDTSKQIDPNIRNSFALGLVKSMSAGFDENNDNIKEVLKQLFPQTATDEYLELWASWFGITRKDPVKAEGYAIFTGTASTTIPNATTIQKADGTQYETQASATISAQTIGITTLTRSGSTATATTTANHNLATGLSVAIAGASQTEYNITATINVISNTQFTYTISGTPASPATGTITASFTSAFVAIKAIDYGINGNSAGGSQLTLISPIVDLNDNCYLSYDGLTLGLDAETDDQLRSRLNERCANFTAPFTASGLPVFIKEKIAGITRVWVQTATPSAGYVTIYFTRDNDANIIPTSSQVSAVKNAIIDVDNGIKPANTPDNYVIVSSPTAVPIAITFATLSPNTVAIKTAITTTLTDYFKSPSINVGGDITLNEINALIYGVIDEDGNSPTFTLSAPASTTVISDSQLAILGTITYP